MHKTRDIGQFFEKEYADYAIYVVEHRAIPSIIDGLKPSYRKIIHVAEKIWKTGKEKDKKVEVFAALVHAETKFHHGAGSLQGAVVSMAQNFKNNLPLLEDIGQYGSLRQPDAGATRYISTRLHSNFRLVYKDFELLTPQYDEGDQIEPKYFLPILPMVIINGTSGIAVGFSSDILNRDPLEVIDQCIRVLRGKPALNLQPKLKGYLGKYEQYPGTSTTWLINGNFTIVNSNTVKITELPPSITYEKYEEYLNKLVDEKKIVSYDNDCRENIDYTIKFRREDLAELQEKGGLIKLLKLQERYTENLTTLDENGNVKVFNNVAEIIEYFVHYRLKYYEKRKEFTLQQIEEKISFLKKKSKYIQLVIDGKIRVFKTQTDKVIEQIVENGIDKHEGSYGYLLSIPNGNFTQDKVDELLKNIENLESLYLKIKESIPSETYIQELLELKNKLNNDKNY